MATTTSYPSDVSDEEWAVAVPYLTLLSPIALQRKHDLRAVFNAVRYLAHRALRSVHGQTADGYDYDCRRLRAEIGLKQGQLKDFEARMGRPFEHSPTIGSNLNCTPVLVRKI